MFPLAIARYGTSRTSAISDTLVRMASGLRMKTASVDPAGMVSSQYLRAAMAALESESRVAERVHAAANVADGAVSEISSMLGEANALLVANANTGALTASERAANQLQLDSILDSVNRVARSTTHGGSVLLDGTTSLTADGRSVRLDSASTRHLGATLVNGITHHLADLGSGRAMNIANGDLTGAAAVMAAAIDEVNTLGGGLGAFQNDVIDTLQNSIATAYESTASAYAQIVDANFAVEVASLARAETLQYAALHTSAMANTLASQVLSLFSGL